MKLAEYLAEKKQSAQHFAEEADLSRATVFRIMKDGAKSLVTIRKVFNATGGKVTADELAYIPRKRSKRRAA
jgi:DNA-binding phage protein